MNYFNRYSWIFLHSSCFENMLQEYACTGVEWGVRPKRIFEYRGERGGGLKNGRFWAYVLYGLPLIEDNPYGKICYLISFHLKMSGWPFNSYLFDYLVFAINGRRIYGLGGGWVYTPLTIFFDFWFRSLRYEKDFLPVLSKLSQASMVKARGGG